MHIQLISNDSKNQIDEAHHVLNEIDKDVFSKVPVTWEGLKTIKYLKTEGIHVTATCIYDILQAYEALDNGADYIAPVCEPNYCIKW